MEQTKGVKTISKIGSSSSDLYYESHTDMRLYIYLFKVP